MPKDPQAVAAIERGDSVRLDDGRLVFTVAELPDVEGGKPFTLGGTESLELLATECGWKDGAGVNPAQFIVNRIVDLKAANTRLEDYSRAVVSAVEGAARDLGWDGVTDDTAIDWLKAQILELRATVVELSVPTSATGVNDAFAHGAERGWKIEPSARVVEGSIEVKVGDEWLPAAKATKRQLEDAADTLNVNLDPSAQTKDQMVKALSEALGRG
ncbi:MAG: hypothetical protein KIT11_05430 [Fimbriimonadaceae bacterium]|nr:hypothetical protein [Fimbriimonadaceae bacterium]QYK56666.1 MAG: hypothetical protein KF733_04090 [Fimbriimonadaceae bacterium]